MASKELKSSIGIKKARDIIKKEMEINKTEKVKLIREEREKFKEKKFELKQEKKREKHKGH